jgi:hypothetical protein
MVTGTGKPYALASAWRLRYPRPVLRRYASLARHGVDPVSRFNRQVREAWSWVATPREVRERNFRRTSPSPKAGGWSGSDVQRSSLYKPLAQASGYLTITSPLTPCEYI